jgi:hypothetical protein
MASLALSKSKIYQAGLLSSIGSRSQQEVTGEEIPSIDAMNQPFDITANSRSFCLPRF